MSNEKLVEALKILVRLQKDNYTVHWNPAGSKEALEQIDELLRASPAAPEGGENVGGLVEDNEPPWIEEAEKCTAHLVLDVSTCNCKNCQEIRKWKHPASPSLQEERRDDECECGHSWNVHACDNGCQAFRCECKLGQKPYRPAPARQGEEGWEDGNPIDGDWNVGLAPSQDIGGEKFEDSPFMVNQKMLDAVNRYQRALDVLRMAEKALKELHQEHEAYCLEHKRRIELQYCTCDADTVNAVIDPPCPLSRKC
jgi:hypothetical protein